ncbi:MAG: hypothetical protein N2170_08620, partial [Bacteroidia bacterium]|nr:hypothetical protein [Bacteroidia bacterium]
RAEASRQLHIAEGEISIAYVRQFLQGKAQMPSLPLPSPSPAFVSPPSSSSASRRTEKGFYLKGIFYPTHTVRDLVEMSFRKVEELMPGFLLAFYRSDRNGSRSRRYISQRPEELFSEDFRRDHPEWRRQHVRGFVSADGQKWWLMVNISAAAGKAIVQSIAEVAGLPWGREEGIKVVWPDT